MDRINLPLIASTVSHRSITSAGAQTLSNFFYLPIEDHTGTRNSGILKGTPGFSLYKDLTGSVIRGGIVPGDGFAYIVRDNTVYKLTTALVATSLGTLSTSSGSITMAASQTEVSICDGVKIWSIVLATGTLTDNTSILFGYVPKFVIAQNSRFYYGLTTLNRVYISNTLASNVVQSTAFITISVNYGTLMAARASAWYQYYIADNTTEVWVDQGVAGAVPIVRPDGMSIPVGIAAKDTAQVISETLYMLGKDANGLLGVVAIKGNEFTTISDYSFLARIKEFVSISDAYAFVDSFEGHPIYCITFPSKELAPGHATNLGYTICYDTITQLWIEHPSYNATSTRQDRYEANCSFFFNNLNIIGSYKSGKLYYVSSLVYDEAGQAITREITTPHVLFRGNLGTVSNLELEVESNEGLASGQGLVPTVMFRMSKDYGNTYGIETSRAISELGKFKQRARWTSLGSSKSFTFNFRFSDPIRWVIPALTAEASINT